MNQLRMIAKNCQDGVALILVDLCTVKADIEHLTKDLITFDGTNLTDIDVKWFRAQIGTVQQEPVLFTGTVAENIRCGALNATEQQVIEAAKQANAHDFIVKLPEGYRTQLNQNATGLSVGQKQRIAIARALIRNPRILILDEATSALDSQSEALVQTALSRACVGRTVFVVAHRLSTVRTADRIVVLDRGHVKEIGTHAELAQAGGLYATLLNAQQHTTLDEVVANGVMGTNERETLSSVTEPLLTQPDKSTEGDDRALSQELFGPEKPSVTIRPGRRRRRQHQQKIFTLANEPDQMQNRINLIAGIMALLGLIRLASSTFQELAWFDEPDNQVGALTAHLASDANKVHPICGSAMGQIVESVVLLIFSLIVAFYYNWKLTLIVAVFFPVIMFASFINVSPRSCWCVYTRSLFFSA
ncbi:unnamed protein product [Echinostoma caproni]|uniref:ABC transporter domain-containing protein n=1 Tax=Echinostoma caproni TaxID=27848 RepID=A0A183AKB6_9TREM|nr:unnamed protein product [Echinostoma caproni]